MSEEETAVDALGLVGTVMAEKYAIESVVGQGGFATVYRATHVLWKRTVAVKVFTALGQVASNQRQALLDDFIREGALLADLSERSTAICQARDVGMFTAPSGESVPYMVLEWLEGETLEAVLERERAAGMPARSLVDTIRLLDPVAEALALAHLKGIAHRDVKPANVFVLSTETGGNTGPSLGVTGASAAVKLLDFGIAKVVQDAQKMGFGKTAGHITSFTPLYGAPEQFNRAVGATGPWTDVFAFALVVTEVVTGREPMSGESLMQLAFASSDPSRRPTPRTLGTDVSDEVETIFLRAVAVKPEERWQTAGEFWNALRTAVLGPNALGMNAFGGGRPSLAFASAPRIVAAPPSTSSANVVAATQLADSQPAFANPGALPTADAPAPLAPRKTKAPLVLLVALGALVAGGAVAMLTMKSKGEEPAPPQPPATTAIIAATPVTAPSAPTCPAGMLRIPGGEFFMGSDEKDALDLEKPAHKVRLSSYCLDELEVSVSAYKSCSDKGACRRASKENVWPGITAVQRKVYDPLCNINDPEAKATHPINCVEWDQAREFCEARGARLPTEAEWEFAARGPDGRIYPWGDEAPSATLLNACGKECTAWQRKHPDPDSPVAEMYKEDDGYPNTAPVGSFPKGKSRYGVQDVVGNVWEWVADWHADYPKPAGPVQVDPQGPPSGTDRVIRGGSWNGSEPSWVRPSFRFHVAPSARSYGFGFRCAQSLGS